MNNTCPQCSAVYAVAEKDIGRRIACKKCGTALVVTDTGLKRDDSSGPARADDLTDDRGGRKRLADEDDRGSKVRERNDDDDDRGSRRRERRSGGGPNIGGIVKKMKQFADVATWLYAFGLVLTIYSFFSPQIDQAKVASRLGDINQAAAEDKSDEHDINNRNDGKPSEDDRKRRDTRRKEYQREEPRLKIRKDLAEASAQQSQWWNIMYRLVGFSLLALGSIAYLTADQPNVKRILGAVTIAIILLEVVSGGAGLNLQLGGSDGPPRLPAAKS